LLHGGHSSVYARGRPNGDPRGWRVGISHPWQNGRRLAEVWLRGRSLGTSAATFQHLEYNGKKLGHVLDPRSGWPAEGIASASVLAPTGAEADALSTAFYVGGVELARRYCAAHPEVGAVLLPEGDGAELVILNLGPRELN
jgi:FAD:protein FMN transferase